MSADAGYMSKQYTGDDITGVLNANIEFSGDVPCRHAIVVENGRYTHYYTSYQDSAGYTVTGEWSYPGGGTAPAQTVTGHTEPGSDPDVPTGYWYATEPGGVVHDPPSEPNGYIMDPSSNTPIFTDKNAWKNYVETGDISGADNYLDLIIPDCNVHLRVQPITTPNVYATATRGNVTSGMVSVKNPVLADGIANSWSTEISVSGGRTCVNYSQITGELLIGYEAHIAPSEQDPNGQWIIMRCRAHIGSPGTNSHMIVSDDRHLHVTLEVMNSADPDADPENDTNDSNNTVPSNTNVTTNTNEYGDKTTLTKTYNMTDGELRLLGGDLWDNTPFQDWDLLNSSPMDNLVSCVAMPVNISGDIEQIKIGNVTMQTTGKVISSKVKEITVFSNQYVPRWYNNWADGLMGISLYLPYIGIKSLDTDSVLDESLTLKYYFDVVTGTCEAVLYCDSSPLYKWGGNCGVNVSLTSRNNTQYAMGLISGAIDIGASALAENPIGVAKGVLNMATTKRPSETKGSPSPLCAMKQPTNVYLIREIPQVTIPTSYGHDHGWNCCETHFIGDIANDNKRKGYCQLADNVDVSNITCTQQERDMIKQILTSGFYAN